MDNLVEKMAWPVVAILGVFLFRKPLSNFLDIVGRRATGCSNRRATYQRFREQPDSFPPPPVTRTHLKMSYENHAPGSPLRNLVKRRSSRWTHRGAQAWWIPSPARRGVNFELTQLTINGAKWWTVGFEAFGDSDKLPDIVNAVLALPDATAQLPRLALEESLSYPAWFPLVARPH